MRRALPVAWSLFAGLALLELCLRVVGSERRHFYLASPDPRLVYELDPQHPEINRDGLRGREIDRDWLRSGFVIAAIGDSHTYSVRATSYETSYPAQLERSLRRLGRGNVSVLNFGVPGYNLAQELALLRARALGFDPDLVILQYTANDDHVCNHIQPAHPRLNHWIHRSRALVGLWTGVLYRTRFGREQLFGFFAVHAPDALLYQDGLVGTPMDPVSRHPPDDPALVPARYHYMLGRENFERHLREFGRVLRDHDIPGLATGFIEPSDEAPYREAGFDLLPFSRVFSEADLRRFGYRPEQSSDHLNDAGSAFLADALARYIERHYLEPAPAPGG